MRIQKKAAVTAASRRRKTVRCRSGEFMARRL
jgi:hypothetical protein